MSPNPVHLYRLYKIWSMPCTKLARFWNDYTCRHSGRLCCNRCNKTQVLSFCWLNWPIRFFNDQAVCRKKKVYLTKKAQLLIADVYERFWQEKSESFAFPDINRLTALCDNVLPCVLEQLNILEYPVEWKTKIENQNKLISKEWECDICYMRNSDCGVWHDRLTRRVEYFDVGPVLVEERKRRGISADWATCHEANLLLLKT